MTPNPNALTPPQSDCVEVGNIRIVGGVRPQNFDVGYRPDGVRFAFDSKTLNEKKSIGKNWQNMVNDLATEATTVLAVFLMLLSRLCPDQPTRTQAVDAGRGLASRVGASVLPGRR